jgi:hypothetical protein
MSEKPISLLSQRMIEDMSVRNFVEKTRNDYIRQPHSADLFCCRSLIGRDTAQQFAAFLRQTQLPANRSTRYLDYQATLQRTLTPRLIETNMITARCACPGRSSPPNKHP